MRDHADPFGDGPDPIQTAGGGSYNQALHGRRERAIIRRMQRKLCRRDMRLSAAMVIALLVLAALYAVALAIPLWLQSLGLLSWLWALTLDAVLLFLLGAQYWSLDSAALRASSARLVTREEAPRLHEAVERLAALADMPKPRLAVVDTAVPDAFACGRDPRHSTVVITRGLVDALEPAEIEAVLAHELAHVVNRDGAVMTVASFPALTLRAAIDDASLKMWLLGFPLMVLACAAYAVSTGLMVTVSRCREYAADRSAAMLTGTPEQLMSALQKIAGRMHAIPGDDLRAVASMSALFIVPTRIRALTHPPLSKRLERLMEISRELGKPQSAAALDSADAPRPWRSNLLWAVTMFLVVFGGIVLIGTVLR
jgi:heat shock protein HtpX